MSIALVLLLVEWSTSKEEYTRLVNLPEGVGNSTADLARLRGHIHAVEEKLIARVRKEMKSLEFTSLYMTKGKI
jgi:hypothetical protein